MTRCAVLALVLGWLSLAAAEARAIGCDLPKDVLAMQGPNCVHGFMVNWEDTFFFAGETAELNKFLESYSKRDDLKRRVVIHAGTKKARSPWDNADRDIPVDWSYYIWNAAQPDVSNPAPSQVDVWLGSRIKLDELRIPDPIEVASGGEIEKVIEERSKKQAAEQPQAKEAQPAETDQTNPAADSDDAPPDALIGYTEHRTDLPGGRHANVKTRRAVVVKADGTGRRVLAEELTREPGYATQFVGWSPDGKAARLSRGWKSDEVGQWEEEHKTFRPPGDGVRYDAYLVDLASGEATMQSPEPDGKKSDLVKSLVHGMSISPDGKRSAFEDPAYRLFLADADGANARQIETGLRFHLMPSWSPDGAWLLFVAGEHYDCHPHVVQADGAGLTKLASRNGYRGVIDILDVYDFHDGSSDLPAWAPDSKSVFYTAAVGGIVELFRVTLDGRSEQLTETPAGSMHYHPAPSPDGKWLAYGSKRDGVRQLYVMRLGDMKEWRITDLAKGRAAMWPSWQPRAAQ